MDSPPESVPFPASTASPPAQRTVAKALQKLLVTTLIVLAILLPIYFGPISVLKHYILFQDAPKRQFISFWIALITFTCPFFTGFILRKTASKVAMRAMQTADWTAAEICSLYDIAYEGALGPKEYVRVFSAPLWEKIVIGIRIIGDIIVYIGTPFVSLAVFYLPCNEFGVTGYRNSYGVWVPLQNDEVCMGYNWGLLVFAILWPLIWMGVVCLVLLVIGGGQAMELNTGLPVPLKSAADLVCFGEMRHNPTWDEKTRNPVLTHSGRWRYGEREGSNGVEVGVFPAETCQPLLQREL
jgi:hypothetical protein